VEKKIVVQPRRLHHKWTLRREPMRPIRIYSRHAKDGVLLEASQMDKVFEALKREGIVPDLYTAATTDPTTGYHSYTPSSEELRETAIRILDQFGVLWEETP
jgi:hypothetical protein